MVFNIYIYMVFNMYMVLIVILLKLLKKKEVVLKIS